MKTLKISSELHQKLKIEAANKNTTILKLLMEILMKHFGMLMVLIMFTGCATMYTEHDKVEYSRYEHDQKIAKGLTVREVMDMFGSPSSVDQGTYTTRFTYYRKIQCQSVYCSVLFENGKVIQYRSFRQEYINFLD